MSTNYYARYNLCEECNRYDELHIGKNTPTLRGYVGHYVDDKVTEITSWQQWKTWLTTTPGVTVFAEHGAEYTIAELIAMFEESSNAERRKQFDAVKNHEWESIRASASGSRGVPGVGQSWIDDDGFSFYGGEFC
jgi:hypothetical protein